jgi:hypothetical protein
MLGVLLHELPVPRMDPHLRGRQTENQPASANVHCLEAKHVAHEGPVRFRILAIEEKMHPVYHGFSLTITGCASPGADSKPTSTGVFQTMCRNIKTLFNFDPPVTEDEVRAASLQFVRKITGFNKPSKANEEAFQAAIDEIADISLRLLHSLETNAPPKNREEEAAKAKARAAERFAT